MLKNTWWPNQVQIRSYLYFYVYKRLSIFVIWRDLVQLQCAKCVVSGDVVYLSERLPDDGNPVPKHVGD